MNRTKKKVCAVLLSLAMCGNLLLPAQAANESNVFGITFDAVLDTPSITTSSENQTVVMRVNASEGALLEGIGGEIYWDEGLELVSITNDDPRIDFTGSINLENGRIAWDGTDNLDQLENVTNIAVATFLVPANTPAGTYNVGLRDLELCQNYGDIWENAASVQATLTITDDVEVDGYTAGLVCPQSAVRVGDSVEFCVGVSHPEDNVFAAGEICLKYDSSKLSFNESGSDLGEARVQDSDGTLTLEDYGADKALGNSVYTLCFDAIQEGIAEVSLSSAAFVNKENAVKSDLLEAELSPSMISVTVDKKAYTVSLPAIFTGAQIAEDGEDYTFAQADSKNYTYGTVTATMNGSPVPVTDNIDGTYTIAQVRGNLVISGSRVEKVYDVEFVGNAAQDIVGAETKATYNKDYSFTMPSEDGWAYSLEKVTIGGVPYTGYRVENLVYTISGVAIQGDIVITVNKVATKTGVTVEGDGAGAAFGYDPVANVGEDYTLTLTPEAGYFYTVSATMSGEPVEVIDNQDNSYTVQKVNGPLVFVVDRTVIVEGVSFDEYLTLDGSVMWLIKNEISLPEDKVPTYDGNNMLWSEQYQCYCYLVIAPTLTQEEVNAKIGLKDSSPVSVDYGMDVNKTGLVDASDAQLVYNMYNAVYHDFDTDITVEKCLCADITGDGKVNVQDATAIISSLFQ